MTDVQNSFLVDLDTMTQPHVASYASYADCTSYVTTGLGTGIAREL